MFIVYDQLGIPLDVEGFPPSAQRSYAGALHLHPGVTTEVTEDEAQHLKRLGLKFQQVANVAPRLRAVSAAPAIAEATSPPAPPEVPQPRGRRSREDAPGAA